MSQHDMIIENASGATVRADLNLALQALASTSKGNARPSTVYAGEMWIDDNTPSSTVWTLYVYDGTDDIRLGQIDTVNNEFLPEPDSTQTYTKKTLDAAILTGTTDLQGGQIKFPATQNASADANTLDDYEEGTFTPSLTFATPGNLSVAYTGREGRYTKVGRMVTVDFNILTSAFSHSTASGALSITGLPFTSQNVSVFSIGALVWSGMMLGAGYSSVVAAIQGNATSVTFTRMGSASAATSTDAAQMPTGGTVILYGSITYPAA